MAETPVHIVDKATFREVNAAALPWIEANHDRPFFLYVHAIDTHGPYVAPPEALNPDWVNPDYSGEFLFTINSLTPRPVPAPPALVLLATGLAVLGFMRRKRFA